MLTTQYIKISGLASIDYLGITAGWMDPGVFALIGAAAFFAGVSRLTIALAVIMTELSNDIHFLLPIMLAVMIAKFVADFMTHPLYHATLEIKCVPFLDHEPVIKVHSYTCIQEFLSGVSSYTARFCFIY